MNTSLPCIKYLIDLIMQIDTFYEVIDNSLQGSQNEWPHYIWINWGTDI